MTVIHLLLVNVKLYCINYSCKLFFSKQPNKYELNNMVYEQCHAK